MAKFDNLFPDKKDAWMSPDLGCYPPVSKFICEDKECEGAHGCLICGAPHTTWVNVTAMQRVCSVECNIKLWDALITTYIASSITVL